MLTYSRATAGAGFATEQSFLIARRRFGKRQQTGPSLLQLLTRCRHESSAGFLGSALPGAKIASLENAYYFGFVLPKLLIRPQVV